MTTGEQRHDAARVLDGATTDEAFIQNKGLGDEGAPFMSFTVANLTAAQHTMKIQAAGHGRRPGDPPQPCRCNTAHRQPLHGLPVRGRRRGERRRRRPPLSRGYQSRGPMPPKATGSHLAAHALLQTGAFQGTGVQFQYNDTATIASQLQYPMDGGRDHDSKRYWHI